MSETGQQTLVGVYGLLSLIIRPFQLGKQQIANEFEIQRFSDELTS